MTIKKLLSQVYNNYLNLRMVLLYNKFIHTADKTELIIKHNKLFYYIILIQNSYNEYKAGVLGTDTDGWVKASCRHKIYACFKLQPLHILYSRFCIDLQIQQDSNTCQTAEHSRLICFFFLEIRWGTNT